MQLLAFHNDAYKEIGSGKPWNKFKGLCKDCGIQVHKCNTL
jgi:hypothetical protein